MSDHYYLWAVVLVNPTGTVRMVVASGLSRVNAEKRRRMLTPQAPEGWTYELERRAA